MQRVQRRILFLILMVFSMAVAADTATAQVYKVVDENGNVTYTDQQPKDGSEPIKLAPISVIETPDYKQPARKSKKKADGKEMSVRELRRRYADFAIVSPRQEESIWYSEAALSVAWNTGKPLQSGMQVSIIVDGKQHSKTTSRRIVLPKLERGEHKIEAQLTDAKNRTIATAEPVIFFVKRPNVFSNPSRSRPSG